MSYQLIKARMLSVGLLALSTCGTLAVFGSVPMLARILPASTPQNSPRQAEQPHSPNWWFSEQQPSDSSDRS